MRKVLRSKEIVRIIEKHGFVFAPQLVPSKEEAFFVFFSGLVVLVFSYE